MLVTCVLTTVCAYSETLPDPTRPANYAVRQISRETLPPQLINWDVRAIKTSATGRNAVVNGRIVKVGDAIDTATIVDITPDSVVVAYDRKQLVLRLLPQDIKKRTADSINRATD